MMKSKVSAPAIKDFLNELESFTGQLDEMKDDNKIKRQVIALQKILT